MPTDMYGEELDRQEFFDDWFEAGTMFGPHRLPRIIGITLYDDDYKCKGFQAIYQGYRPA